jgi:hypothetical protein
MSAIANDNMFYIKDCSTSCTEPACNSLITPTAAKFSVDKPQDSCFTCSYSENADGTVSGNVFCADKPDNLENASQNCPLYANAGCYTGTNANYVSINKRHI